MADLNNKFKLSIIIVTYQSREFIGKCLDSIKRFEPPAPYEIFVVDNASTDGTVDFVQEKYPWVQVIRNESNQGFGRANNIAIQKARGQFVLALNPDAAVTAQALTRLLLIAENTPNLGTLAPNMIFPDGTPQPSHFFFPGIWSEAKKYLWLEKIAEARARTQVLIKTDWSAGAALLFPREIKGSTTDNSPLQMLFDPEIFLYSEDTELCWRLKKLGRKNYATSVATILHAWNKSAEQFYGESISLDRLRAYRDTQEYVMAKHQRGPLKTLRFWLYCHLVAINAWQHVLALTLLARRFEASDRKQRLAEHRAKIKVYGREVFNP